MSEAKDNLRKDDDVRWQWSGATWTTEGCPQGERGGVHQFGVPPKTATGESADQQPEGSLRAVSEAKDNMAGVEFVCLRFASTVLANGSMSSNQSGEGAQLLKPAA